MEMTSSLPNRGIPLMDDDFITSVISMNFSGRFKGQEAKDLGQTVIQHMLTAKNVDLFFGQQANFRLTGLPSNYEIIGTQRAFLLYNKKHFQVNDEIQYRHFLRDLEIKGRLQKYYLPDASYTLCKMKCKIMDDTSFIAMSWFTDENKDDLQSQNLLRKLLSFTANLCAIEEMPVIIAGSFRMSLDDIKQVVYNEFEGFRCYGYKTDKSRRAARMSNIYISCPPLKLSEVKPIVSGKIEMHGSRVSEKWRHLEEAFYWDPVFARMLRRNVASSVASPVSPRAISPPMFEDQEVRQHEALEQNECPYINPHHLRQTFPSADNTLKVLLAESERIKELVTEAETKVKKRLEVKNTFYSKKEMCGLPLDPSNGSHHKDAVDSMLKIINNGTRGNNDKNDFFTPFDLESEARKVSESLRSGARSSFDEDEEFQILEKACDIETFESSGRSPSSPSSNQLASVATVASSNLLTLLETPPSNSLRKTPSYIDLYDEELIETSKVCYMQ